MSSEPKNAQVYYLRENGFKTCNVLLHTMIFAFISIETDISDIYFHIKIETFIWNSLNHIYLK